MSEKLKAFRVEYAGFEDEVVCYIAAKSRGSARFKAAYSMADDYYHDLRKLPHCLSLIKSVRRDEDFDFLIDKRRKAPRYISKNGGIGQ